MQIEDIKCPCCGQRAPAQGSVRVSLEENLLFFRHHSVVLTPRLAELAYLLARRMPGLVTHEQIIAGLWGDVSSEFVDKSVAVAVTQLRKRLAPIGLHIMNVWGRGYLLAVAKPSRTERTPAPPDPHNLIETNWQTTPGRRET